MISQILVELTRRYTEPHRHYHNIEHIAYALRLGRELPLSDDQILALWFHDAIYDAHSSTNEEDSARLAVELLGAEGYSPHGIKIIEQIVLDTKRHEPTIEPAAAVIDLDLASLSAPWDEFDANSRKLEREYAHLRAEEHAAGQRRFLEGFLARERIYWTEWGASREAAARDNLARALRRLAGDAPQ